MKAYTVCATAQASIFTVFWAFSQRNCQIVEDVWTMSEQVVKGEDVRRQTKETPRSRWPLFYKLCKKCYRKSCKYMRNNSTRLKGKKKLQLNNIKVSRTTVMWPTKVGKPWREKSGAHFMQAWHQKNLQTLIIPKDDQPANSRDMNTLKTIWIIVDEITYKDSAPKILDELRQRLRFACKNVNIDTLWELVHSIPHRLENVRKHNGRYSIC